MQEEKSEKRLTSVQRRNEQKADRKKNQEKLVMRKEEPQKRIK